MTPRRQRNHEQRAPGALRRPPLAIPAALAAVLFGLTFVTLLAHAWYYRFQCDDAFISFRYARNLSHGYGLVFNPGLERVEGYTNFLWVLALAALDRLGLPPERGADALSLAGTVLLWALLVWFVTRQSRPWNAAVVAPALFLAATRSVAVWSTSGLETRAFELLTIAGVLRCAAELEQRLRGDRPPRSIAGWCFGLATLTRPEGIIVGLPVVAASAWMLHSRGRPAGRWLAETLLPFLGLVLGHLAFRRAYYGEWLPNTYYAKVSGRLRWDWGLSYLGAFALEYGAYIWLPVLFVGVRRCVRSGRGHLPILFAAAAVPLTVSVVAIGGDHFEYRALDFLFPLIFLLLGEGVAALSEAPGGRTVAAVTVALILFGLCDIPFRSRRDFPANCIAGFPGETSDLARNSAAFLAPERDPVFGLPGLRSIASAHQALTRFLTGHFVAIRQEEHRLFLERAVAQGMRLRALVAAGGFPSDTRIAIDCVGAIPYFSDLPVLDRHGLTDVNVARLQPGLPGLMAHEKVAGPEDARRFGVELWATDPVDLIVPITSQRLLYAMTHPSQDAPPTFVAPLDPDWFVLCSLPAGLSHVQARMPRLRFVGIFDTTFTRAYIAGATPAFQAVLRRQPDNQEAMNCLAFLLMVQHRFDDALAQYQALGRLRPEDAEIWERIVVCAQQLGRVPVERVALEHELALARARGDAASAERALARLQALGGPGKPK